MSDIEETVATDGLGVDDSGAGEVTPVETPEPVETPDVPEPSFKEKLAKVVEGKNAPVVEAPAAEVGEKPDPNYKPDYNFNVLDKKHEVPKEFHALIKDAKSEKMVKEVFEKAFGLESVKTKANEVRTERDKLADENRGIKSSIDGLRQIVQSAVSTGNFLKLDDFFARLKIPEQHIMQWAVQKIKLSEMPPEQRQSILGQQEAERQAETLRQQALQSQTQVQTTGQQLKQLQMDFTLAKPEVKSIADAFDAQVGRPGAFRQQVARVGLLEWTERKVDLTPEQAVEKLIKDFGLKAPAPAPASAPAAADPAKKVIVRENKTIPNLKAGSASPLKAKPRSIEDLRKLSEQYAQAE